MAPTDSLQPSSPKIVDKLKEMEKEGHLAKVTQPTDWLNSMVISTRGRKIRICLDPSDLNNAVRREHYPIPTVEEIVAKIPDAKVFIVLDPKNGYLLMKLDYESELLTTMNTPIDRYRLRTPLPTARGLLKPQAHNTRAIKARMERGKHKQKYYIVDLGDRRLRGNRVALRTDSPKSHAGY